MNLLKLSTTSILSLLVSFSLSLPAHALSVQSKSSSSFIHSIGVNTHLTYSSTPYQRFDDLILPKLQQANILHIRDGAYNQSSFFDKLKKLSSFGIKSNLIFSGNPPNEVLSILNSTQGSIESVEGANESDLPVFNFSYQSKKFPEGTRNYQKDLFNTIKSSSITKSLSVISPSMGWGENASKLGYVGDYADFCNLHSYPNIGQPPTIDLDSYFIPHSNKMCSNLPKIVTETGYHNQVNHTTGISEDMAGKYIPRLLLENFNRNISRTYLYEFINQSNNSDDQSNYGLLYSDGSPKPAFTFIKNFTNLIKDVTPNPSFTPSSLNYSLEGNTSNIHSTLLQNSKGDFFLVLWQEARSWDNNSKSSISIPPIDVKLSLTSLITQAQLFNPLLSISPFSTFTGPIDSNGKQLPLSSLNLSVPDSPIVIKLSLLSNVTSNKIIENKVTVYRDKDYKGIKQELGIGTYEANKGQLNTVGNDSISSIKVPKGLSAYICIHESQPSLCKTLPSGDYYSLPTSLNDQISLVKVSSIQSTAPSN